jgi:hypothetical protein
VDAVDQTRWCFMERGLIKFGTLSTGASSRVCAQTNAAELNRVELPIKLKTILIFLCHRFKTPRNV